MGITIILKSYKYIWAGPWESVSYVICEQQRRRSTCASAQSDQRLCCSLLRWCNISRFYSRNFKTLASFCGCAGWFVSGLGGNSRRQVLSWHGSYGCEYETKTILSSTANATLFFPLYFQDWKIMWKILWLIIIYIACLSFCIIKSGFHGCLRGCSHSSTKVLI